MNISIVTGTLNRLHILPALIDNTVNKDNRLELVLVDGGSNDGTIEYLEKLQYSQIKLIKYGQRSSYPHYMNLGIKNSSYDLICQWNDDVILLNEWQEVFDSIDDSDVFLFAWHNQGERHWNLLNDGYKGGEVVMNYGIYRRHVFEQVGLYNMKYKYYCADGEMALRAFCKGFKVKNLHNIHVEVLPEEKKAILYQEDITLYYQSVKLYQQGVIDEVELLCKN